MRRRARVPPGAVDGNGTVGGGAGAGVRRRLATPFGSSGGTAHGTSRVIVLRAR